MSKQSFHSRVQKVKKEAEEANRRKQLQREQEQLQRDLAKSQTEDRRQKALNELRNSPQYRQIYEEAHSTELREAYDYICKVCRVRTLWQRIINPRFHLDISEGGNLEGNELSIGVSMKLDNYRRRSTWLTIELRVNVAGQISYLLSDGYATDNAGDSYPTMRSLESWTSVLDALAAAVTGKGEKGIFQMAHSTY